ncbi:MG2 domain protein [uncultured archaeon]|nr:MG2 domain protein [uncultured archaeon]
MKRGISFLVLILLMSSLVSAEIIFTQPVSKFYNLGDNIFSPVTIKTLNSISGFFKMNLICNGTETPFYTTMVNLKPGEEISLVDPRLVLIRTAIGQNSGICRIKAILGADYKLSDEFTISNTLNIAGGLDRTSAGAGEIVSLSGKVTRETGENANGLIDVQVITNDVNQNIQQTGTISDGVFNMNLSLPSTIPAGDYLVDVKAYESDSDGLTTNQGTTEYNLSIIQVPTNLELTIVNKQINPGEAIKARLILHDQTGVPINSTAFITLKDSTEKIIDQQEINLSDEYSYLTKSNEPPASWTVYAVSGNLSAQDTDTIKVNEQVDIQIANQTILITNIGNVLYNKTVLVRVGDSPLNIQVTLGVGESRKYVVNAPNGEYNVEVSTGDNQQVTETMSLTGKAVGIQEASAASLTNIAWILLILVLAVAVFLLAKKIYKTRKPFFGRMLFSNSNRPKKEKEVKMLVGEDFKMVAKTGSKAELSLSIRGEQQDATVICLKVKDLSQMKRGSPGEAIAKIIDIVDESKGTTYENQDYLFFIFAPLKTKTMRNEKTALEISETIQGILAEHNRKFNQKIEFGISLNVGTIVAKIEDKVFKFMTMGSLMSITKRIASLSKGEVLLSDKINDLLRLHSKAEKEIREGTPVFVLKGIKRENEEARKFINQFMERQKKPDY